MDCNEVLSRLDDYVDGEVDSKNGQSIEEHLKACPACRAEHEGLRSLLGQARRLPSSVAPRRDLWPDIESRLRGRIIDFGRIRRNPIRINALYYVAAAAAVFLLIINLQTPGPDQPTQSPGPIQPVTKAQPATGDLEKFEQDYLTAKSELMALLKEQEAWLSPETVTSMEEGLATLESAVSDIQLALVEHPDNPQLERLLIAAYQNEVSLLRQAMELVDKG